MMKITNLVYMKSNRYNKIRKLIQSYRNFTANKIHKMNDDINKREPECSGATINLASSIEKKEK